VAQDPEAPAPEEPDPIEVSPEPEASDSGQDSPEPQQPTDAEELTAQQRISAAQARLTAKNRENADLRAQIAALESRRPDGGEPDEAETPREAEYRARLEQMQWETTESVYGPELVGAYVAAAELYASDPTPMGALASYEAYHQARLGEGAAAPEPDALPSRSEAVKPRVDANRSDAAVLSQLDNDIEEAKRTGDLDKGVGALMRRAREAVRS
jgi:hypothetical protein